MTGLPACGPELSNGLGRLMVDAGAAARFLGDHLEGRLELAFTRFGWTFESEDGDEYDAEGGSDWMYGATVTVGGTY